MSDTPRTDAPKFGASCAEDFCRVLERENAALRKDKERLMDMLRDREHLVSVWIQHAKQSDQKLAAAQQAHQCDLDRRANVVKSLRKVAAENAALREENERLRTRLAGLVSAYEDAEQEVSLLHAALDGAGRGTP